MKPLKTLLLVPALLAAIGCSEQPAANMKKKSDSKEKGESEKASQIEEDGSESKEGQKSDEEESEGEGEGSDETGADKEKTSDTFDCRSDQEFTLDGKFFSTPTAETPGATLKVKRQNGTDLEATVVRERYRFGPESFSQYEETTLSYIFESLSKAELDDLAKDDAAWKRVKCSAVAVRKAKMEYKESSITSTAEMTFDPPLPVILGSLMSAEQFDDELQDDLVFNGIKMHWTRTVSGVVSTYDLTFDVTIGKGDANTDAKRELTLAFTSPSDTTKWQNILRNHLHLLGDANYVIDTGSKKPVRAEFRGPASAERYTHE